jgi:hypothetical protein
MVLLHVDVLISEKAVGKRILIVGIIQKISWRRIRMQTFAFSASKADPSQAFSISFWMGYIIPCPDLSIKFPVNEEERETTARQLAITEIVYLQSC